MLIRIPNVPTTDVVGLRIRNGQLVGPTMETHDLAGLGQADASAPAATGPTTPSKVTHVRGHRVSSLLIGVVLGVVGTKALCWWFSGPRKA